VSRITRNNNRSSKRVQWYLPLAASLRVSGPEDNRGHQILLYVLAYGAQIEWDRLLTCEFHAPEVLILTADWERDKDKNITFGWAHSWYGSRRELRNLPRTKPKKRDAAGDVVWDEDDDMDEVFTEPFSVRALELWITASGRQTSEQVLWSDETNLRKVLLEVQAYNGAQERQKELAVAVNAPMAQVNAEQKELREAAAFAEFVAEYGHDAEDLWPGHKKTLRLDTQHLTAVYIALKYLIERGITVWGMTVRNVVEKAREVADYNSTIFTDPELHKDDFIPFDLLLQEPLAPVEEEAVEEEGGEDIGPVVEIGLVQELDSDFADFEDVTDQTPLMLSSGDDDE
jgi:hypothetical protein